MSGGDELPKVRIKATREDKDGVDRSFVLIDDRILPFTNSNEIYIFVNSDQEYGITVYCQGPRRASTTATLEKAGGKVIEPLKAIVNNDYGVSHASDRFTIAS
jgi:hypothetical protein